ncbi:MAG: DUF692 domain-containing protein [Rickettsiales bacterium]|nr:DUF692 domain-containing protein [Rickettsiales bacterium]
MNKFGYKFLGFGLGLRASHYDYILQNKPKIDWFEIITENYIDSHSGYIEFLQDIRELYPLVMHGVSLSIGGFDKINFEYLKKVKNLAEKINPEWISDHLCYTGFNNINTHDLLPIPYNKQMLSHIAERIKIVQDYLERNIILENPSSYIEFENSTMSEHQFLAELAEKADCGLLLDVNNVFVSSFNHKFDAKKYIDFIPAERIVQIHLAGHTNKGDVIIDTHDNFVIDKVWDLYQYATHQKGRISTMIEWDNNIPLFEVLESELLKAKKLCL